MRLPRVELHLKPHLDLFLAIYPIHLPRILHASMFLLITFFTQLFQVRRSRSRRRAGNVKYRLASAFRSTGEERRASGWGGVHRILP